jgi:AcrR family transcriptional regulator
VSAAVLDLPRRERNKHAKRARIVAAARALFARRGFAATTTAEIARRAGIGTGTLFLYFASKEDLLVEIFREEMDALVAAAFDTLPRRAALLDEIVYVLGVLVAFHERDPELARAFVKEMQFVGDGAAARVFEFIDRLAERIAERVALRQASGELDPEVPSRLVADNCFAIYIARLQKWLGAGRRSPSAELLSRLREALALQLRGLERRATPGADGRRVRRARRA